MWFWIFVVLLWLAGEQWPAFKFVLRLTAGILGVIGLIILAKIGFISVFFATLVEIPINLVLGVFGIIKHLLFNQ